MTNHFQAICEQDGDWYIGFCPEIPGANVMGKTQNECRENLIEAIKLLLEYRYEDLFTLYKSFMVILLSQKYNFPYPKFF
jgi:predicted RNase H-like HicB family nuclease